ncbi:MAG: hypothetical protein LBI95_01450 [Holosporales bacterium]|nr:hypothetical protein [Holosporales bacterium]
MLKALQKEIQKSLGHGLRSIQGEPGRSLLCLRLDGWFKLLNNCSTWNIYVF